MTIKIQEIQKKADKRGWLIEIFKDELKQGQVYLFTLNPGVIRGNHYHKRKKEYFCLLKGKVKMNFEDLKNKKKQEFIINADKSIKKIFIPANILHSVENIGQEIAFVLAFINEKFNSKDPDTYYLR